MQRRPKIKTADLNKSAVFIFEEGVDYMIACEPPIFVRA
jgi:hypothetical protein